MSIVVTGTGHCGMHSWKQFMSDSFPGCKMMVDLPVNFMESVNAYLGGDGRPLREVLDGEVRKRMASHGLVVHHDLSLTFPLFRELFPETRVIWCARRAPQCVNGLCKHHGWDRGFVDGKSIAVPTEIASQVQRNAWYWNRANLNAIDRNDDPSFRVCRLECQDEIRDAFTWACEIEPSKPFPHVETALKGVCPEGVDALKRAVEAHCAETMDALYPGWRDEPDCWEVG